ncbi:hypothetical protein AGMMS50276_16440 [Synergistales bacterium]|nr:hypothetical protein AGMMS50276_16440 [Synergistales bacterium]
MPSDTLSEIRRFILAPSDLLLDITDSSVVGLNAGSSLDVSMIMAVLSAHFSNGFRIDSPIELSRLRRFVAEDIGEEIILSDARLRQTIISCGTLFNGKVYVVLAETKDQIRSLVDEALVNGTEIIFYSAFYEKHKDWLFTGGVVSEDVLRNILAELYQFTQITHKTNYFTNRTRGGAERAKIEREIIRVWGDGVLLNYSQLAERLPYIPFDKIKQFLGQSGDFVWNSAETFTHISKIGIAKQERVDIIELTHKICAERGYISLIDIPLGEIEDKNYELTITAIHNAVFRLCLSENFEKHGKIVTRKGDKLNALEIMKEYCRGIDKCSLDDLLNFEKELTGESHRWVPMEAGYAVLVRTDKNAYVAEKYVDFDVAAIDSVIGLFVKGEYLPLQSVATFAAFPHCEQAWNLFLLESYCRRFSQRFRFDVLSVNSKNAGAIIRKSSRLLYEEILVDAVAKSDLDLERVAVEDFLYKSGYLGKRFYAKAEELVSQAKAIRERRN